MAKKKSEKIVFVVWVDSVSFSDHAWRQKEDFEEMEPSLINSVGFIAKQTKSHVTLVSSIGSNSNARGEICIPMCAVKQIKTLRLP
jgi:hypothetical protein